MAEPINFDEEFEDEFEGEEFSFILSGQTFNTKNFIPPKAFLSGERGFASAIHFFRHVLDEDSRERFDKLVDDSNSRVSARQLDRIAARVIQEVSGRPTR